MGENTSKHRDEVIRTHRLSETMIGALESGRPSCGTANVLGRSGTLVALIERGLITTGRTHKWTQLGYEVAAHVLSGRVPTWAEGMAYADKLAEQQRAEDAERYDPGPTVIGANGWPVPVSAPEVTQAQRDEQLAGRSLRTQADRTDEAAPAPLLSRERIEPRDLVTVDGADRRVWRVERVADFGDDETGREPWAELVHVSGTRTAVPVKRLSHATAAEIMGRPAPRFAVGDRVTIPDRDERVWRIASIIPGDPDGRPVPVKPWASLAHEASRYETVTTTANLDRLAPVPEPGPTSRPIADGAGDFRRGESVIVAQGDGRVWQIDDLRESLGGERFATMTHTGRSPFDTSHTAVPLGRLLHVAPVATSQPATSQIEQQLADLAELIRNVRQVDPDLSRAVERAKYDALRAVLRVLTGWIEGARENCEALGHRGESREQACGQQFTPEDIRRMVNDAAREVGTREPWAPEAKS